jgi:putative membrane protein
MMDQRRILSALLLALLMIFVWSAIRPRDSFTWFLEVLPAIAGTAILAATFPRFRFTTLVYVLIAIHMIILMIGGHYTYAEVPLFCWLRDTFGMARNHYDRVGHFAQGFVPAIIARELLIRRVRISRPGWLFTLVTAVCLAISALYELFEWAVAAATGTAADAFLGTQGDAWDTQKDMALCLAGAMIAQLLLSRWHDRQVAAKKES